MSRRARNKHLDNVVAIAAWIGLAAAIVAFAGFPQAWGVVVASLVIQAMTGRLR